MTKFILTVFSGLFLSSIALASPVTQDLGTNSLFKAALGINSMHNQNNHPAIDNNVRTLYTHESERGNSLFRAVLAIQKVKINLRIDNSSTVSYSRYTATHEKEKHNSLFHGALSK